MYRGRIGQETLRLFVPVSFMTGSSIKYKVTEQSEAMPRRMLYRSAAAQVPYRTGTVYTW